MKARKPPAGLMSRPRKDRMACPRCGEPTGYKTHAVGWLWRCCMECGWMADEAIESATTRKDGTG